MDLYIDRDELSRGLARVQGIIEKRSTHPILSHVLLHASDGALRMTATDTEVAYIGDLAANTSKGGELAVDAASLFQVVRALPEPTVQLTQGSANRLEVRSGRSLFRLLATAADEYPPLPAFDGQGGAVMAEGNLKRLIDQTSFAIASDDVRYGLNGAHIEIKDVDGEQRLRIVSTDGHRLSAAEAAFSGEVVLTPRMLVPRKAMNVMKRLLESSEEPIEIAFGEGAIRLTRPGQTFWFRLLDGEFPDYQAVVPSDNSHRVVLQKSEFSNTLKRVGILVQDRTRAVRFAFGDDELEIQVHNVERGEVKETLPVELDGEPVTVGFNVRYMQDVLAVLSSDRVLMEFAHPLAPCLIRDGDDEHSFFVIMPMRLD
ncbi:MAG: DNA polymerase III subunit beta [Proteobacteria bacterium]|jgi:DNA polymerase III subunit beta|nr:DNA polymerase III subunit beta [Pseudomonadota bacterium]